MKTRSDERTNLTKALVAFQKEVNIVKETSKGYSNRTYASYEDLVINTRPLCVKNNLSVNHTVEICDGEEYLVTWLEHSSGEFTSSWMKIRPDENKDNNQGYGASVSYLKRYGYESILGIGTNAKDVVEQREGSLKKEMNKKAPMPPPLDRGITQSEIEYLKELIKKSNANEAYFLNKFGVATLDYMTQKEFKHAVNIILDAKKER